MNTVLQALQWRRAVKKYDTSKKLSPEQIDTLTEAIRLAPSSAGLQPYKVFVVSDESIRAKLALAAYNQPQITTSSQLFVFAVSTNLDESLAKHYIDVVAEGREVPRESLSGLEAMATGTISNKPENTRIANRLSRE